MRHVQVHFNIKPYFCDICHQCFTQPGQVLRHKATHTGEKAYHCKICDRYFARKDTLRGHIDSCHSKKKDYMCDHCTRRFVTLHALTDHVTTHLGIKRHKCIECGKGFGQVCIG